MQVVAKCKTYTNNGPSDIPPPIGPQTVLFLQILPGRSGPVDSGALHLKVLGSEYNQHLNENLQYLSLLYYVCNVEFTTCNNSLSSTINFNANQTSSGFCLLLLAFSFLLYTT